MKDDLQYNFIHPISYKPKNYPIKTAFSIFQYLQEFLFGDSMASDYYRRGVLSPGTSILL